MRDKEDAKSFLGQEAATLSQEGCTACYSQWGRHRHARLKTSSLIRLAYLLQGGFTRSCKEGKTTVPQGLIVLAETLGASVTWKLYRLLQTRWRHRNGSTVLAEQECPWRT